MLNSDSSDTNYKWVSAILAIIGFALVLVFYPTFRLAKVVWSQRYASNNPAIIYFFGAFLTTLLFIQWSFAGGVSMWLHFLYFAGSIFGHSSLLDTIFSGFHAGPLAGQWWQALLAIPTWVIFLLFRYNEEQIV